jgi:ATP-binding protein involved in chromosome partitioning
VFSTDLLLEEGAPLRWHEPDSARFVWRGTLEVGALREFLSDVVWGDLDLLLIDLPPGTDRLQDLAELAPGMAGVVAVTIPSEESRRAVARAMRAAREAGLALLGVVENMSGYACPGCGARTSLFPGDAGDTLAAEFGVPLVARIPFTPTGCPTLPVGDLAGLTHLLHPGAP